MYMHQISTVRAKRKLKLKQKQDFSSSLTFQFKQFCDYRFDQKCVAL